MAWTKPQFYFSLIFVVAMIMVGIGVAGNSLFINSRINLDEDSTNYLTQINAISSDSGLYQLAKTNVAESSQQSVLEGDTDTSQPIASDNLGVLNIEKERASQSINIFKLVFNIPSAILLSLGLPISSFALFINIFGVLFVAALIIMVWTRIIRG